MRSYGQHCALARALDVVGDRWTLLIVRELMLRGPSRYTDLRNGLPGVATNLLADRLRELEAAGLVERVQAPPPVASTLLTLTPRGEALRPVVHELAIWGLPYMTEGPGPKDSFRSHWLAWPVELFLRDQDPAAPPIAIQVRCGQEPMVLEAPGGGGVEVRAGVVESPDAVITGTPHAVLGLLTGQIDLTEARRAGLRYEGDEAALLRLVPAVGQDTAARRSVHA